MLLLLWTLGASATPPPLPGVPPAVPDPRFTGFDRIYVDPDGFAAGLRPEDATPPPPRPMATVTLQLDLDAVDAAGLDLERIQDAIGALEGARDVRLDTDGTALVWQAPSPRLPTVEVDGHALDDLGALRAFPAPWTPGRVPVPVALEDLVVTNDTLVRVEVEVEGTRVGAVLPGASGTVHAVRPGTYAVGLVTPDGFTHERAVATVKPPPLLRPSPSASPSR